MKLTVQLHNLFLAFLLTACVFISVPAESEETYEATWESLAQHPIPEWLMDAKFGIYAHWGVYSVPAYGNEWYAKLMYDKTNSRNVYEHHRKTYGDPSEFGYKDFIPMFTAENYDPEEWAEVIEKSGARYAGIAVVHHDGFGLWDSDVNRWNAGKMGPKRDLYGDLVRSLRKRDLKIIATFHHFRTYNWFLPSNPENVKEAEEKGYDLFDPQYADFYWNKSTSTQEEFIGVWKAKVTEVINKYRPDVLWFDGGQFRALGLEGDVLSILTYYYNRGLAWNKEVDVLNKLPTSLTFNFPREFGVLTFEAGRDRPDTVEFPWIDDLSIGTGSWGYIEGLKYREIDHIIDGFVDRVSRNGGLVLSLSPKANGELPQEQKDILLAMGDWLRVNGEAIYGTRTWKINAEGPIDKLKDVSGPHKRWIFDNCSSEDIRFTRKDNDLYAIILGWPEERKITITSLGTGTKVSTGGIDSVSLLGSDGELEWSRNILGITIQLPEDKPCKYAYSFKIKVHGKMVLK